jgi:glycosyltransferase involved in cell wall biosynthesis
MLCVPSYHEGLGYTYLEAATFGCIPMCSDIPGPTDFVRDNETGVTVEPGNVESIIQRIVNLFANPELMRSISIQAFEEVKVFHRDTVTHNIAESISNKLDEFTHFRL